MAHFCDSGGFRHGARLYESGRRCVGPESFAQNGIGARHFTEFHDWQITTITGPVAGGLLYGISGEFAYGVSMCLMVLAICCVVLIGRVPQANHAQETSLATLLAGFKFIKSEKIVLGAISLDLFAVLLGGAVALLPIYARDILEVGPWGLGLLRAGPGIGRSSWRSGFRSIRSRTRPG